MGKENKSLSRVVYFDLARGAAIFLMIIQRAQIIYE